MGLFKTLLKLTFVTFVLVNNVKADYGSDDISCVGTHCEVEQDKQGEHTQDKTTLDSIPTQTDNSNADIQDNVLLKENDGNTINSVASGTKIDESCDTNTNFDESYDTDTKLEESCSGDTESDDALTFDGDRGPIQNVNEVASVHTTGNRELPGDTNDNVDRETVAMNTGEIKDINPDGELNEKQPEETVESYDTATVHVVELTVPESSQSVGHEFPALTRLEPGRVGDVVEVELRPGKWYKRITRAVKPPVFEVAEFLTDYECDMIVFKATQQGLETSSLFGVEVEEQLNSGRNSSDIDRLSKTTWLHKITFTQEFLTSLRDRLTKLTELPLSLIGKAEPLQVVNYGPQGHYHAHVDSTPAKDNLPCCFQITCDRTKEAWQWDACCRICRYATVLYFLNDVEAGGETAFPLADLPDDKFKEKMEGVENDDWPNLSLFCQNCSLVVAPKKGTAIMWYSHFVDDKGYLGALDNQSHHGGCDVIRGHKWIANTWLHGSTYEDRFKPSVFG